MQATAYGHEVSRPSNMGHMMARGTFRPGFGISSARWAAQSVPRYEKTPFITASMKANPLLGHPTEFVVSPKTQAAGWKWSRAQTSTVMKVAARVTKYRDATVVRQHLHLSMVIVVGCTYLTPCSIMAVPANRRC